MENQIFVNGQAYDCNRDCTGAMQAATIQQAQAQAKHDADMASLGDGLFIVVMLVLAGGAIAAGIGALYLATQAIGAIFISIGLVIKFLDPTKRRKMITEIKQAREARLAKLSPRERAAEKWDRIHVYGVLALMAGTLVFGLLVRAVGTETGLYLTLTIVGLGVAILVRAKMRVSS
jgi:hypothetical protein